MKWIIFISSFIIMIFISSCVTPQANSKLEPQIIKEWSGSSLKNTEPFTISHSPWKVEWKVIPNDSSAFLGIVVYSARSNLPVTMTGGETDDGTYIYETGTFYINIIPCNCDWKVKVIGIL